MAAMADPRAHSAHADAVHHLAGVAVVPVLVHELALGHRERAQFVLQHCVFILKIKQFFYLCLIALPNFMEAVHFTGVKER